MLCHLLLASYIFYFYELAHLFLWLNYMPHLAFQSCFKITEKCPQDDPVYSKTLLLFSQPILLIKKKKLSCFYIAFIAMNYINYSMYL